MAKRIGNWNGLQGIHIDGDVGGFSRSEGVPGFPVGEKELESKAGFSYRCDSDMNHDRVVITGRLVKIASGVDDHIVKAFDRATLLHEVQIPEVIDPADIHVGEVVAVEHDTYRVGFVETYANFG